MTQKNYGFLPPPTLKEEPKQWLAGTIPYQIVRKKGDWDSIKITGEVQRFKLFDAMHSQVMQREPGATNVREGVVNGIPAILWEDATGRTWSNPL